VNATATRPGGDADLAAGIMVDYVESLRGDLDTLGAAVAGASRDDVRRNAHRIQGASRTVGAEQVAMLAARLEAAAAGGFDDWDAMRSTADDLDVALSRVAAVVDRRTPAHSPLA
jgi:HPt (histidine-containing phosphotransfer) domain-containing protein